MTNLLDYPLWILRGNEKDIINIYNFLTPIVRLANGGYTLNRGYWIERTKDPLQAQLQLCQLIGEFACFRSATTLLDVGGGSAAPSHTWKSMYESLDVTCLDLNYEQLRNSKRSHENNREPSQITYINGSANSLPFADQSIDRIVALESHHHFLPLTLFVQESGRVLDEGGMLLIASPVKITDTNIIEDIIRLGFLSLTLQSKNYLLTYLISVLRDFGFQINDTLHIGSYVFRPLADYYNHNRVTIKERVSKGYPLFIEKLLHSMVLKSEYAYEKGMIDYLLIKCCKR